MSSSVHHIVADLAARLDFIEKSLKEDYDYYSSAQAEASASGGGGGSGLDYTLASTGTMSSSNTVSSAPLPGTTRSSAQPCSSISSCRLNLSQRLASVNNAFNKSLVHATASEIGERLSACSSVLLPSYISSEVVYEPDRLIDAEASAQRYAVIKRRLNGDGQRDLELLKLNIKALCESSFARDDTCAVIADVLAYNGPNTAPIAVAKEKSEESSSAPQSSIREWVTRAAGNNKRAQELHLRLAKAKARYESLVNYSNKQMCVWDLQIEELEKRARRQAAQKR